MSKYDDLASNMRHRITFQSEVLTPDGAGGNTVSWSNFVTVWAQIEDMSKLSGRSLSAEKEFADQVQNKKSYKITMRYLNSITPAMRILYNSRAFNIRSVNNIDEKSEILHIYAEEGVTV